MRKAKEASPCMHAPDSRWCEAVAARLEKGVADLVRCDGSLCEGQLLLQGGHMLAQALHVTFQLLALQAALCKEVYQVLPPVIAVWHQGQA